MELEANFENPILAGSGIIHYTLVVFFEAYLYRNLRSKNQGYWVIDHGASKKLDFMVVLTSSDTDCKYLSIGFSAKIQNVFYQHP